MSRADQLVDDAADRLQRFANGAAAEGGFMAKLAEPLADDASFVRQLKPSLIKARFKGEAPTDRSPEHGTVAPSASPPRKDRPPAEADRIRSSSSGRLSSPGSCSAKVIDWRGHAYPRD